MTAVPRRLFHANLYGLSSIDDVPGLIEEVDYSIAELLGNHQKAFEDLGAGSMPETLGMRDLWNSPTLPCTMFRRVNESTNRVNYTMLTTRQNMSLYEMGNRMVGYSQLLRRNYQVNARLGHGASAWKPLATDLRYADDVCPVLLCTALAQRHRPAGVLARVPLVRCQVPHDHHRGTRLPAWQPVCWSMGVGASRPSLVSLCTRKQGRNQTHGSSRRHAECFHVLLILLRNLTPWTCCCPAALQDSNQRGADALDRVPHSHRHPRPGHH